MIEQLLEQAQSLDREDIVCAYLADADTPNDLLIKYAIANPSDARLQALAKNPANIMWGFYKQHPLLPDNISYHNLELLMRHKTLPSDLIFAILDRAPLLKEYCFYLPNCPIAIASAQLLADLTGATWLTLANQLHTAPCVLEWMATNLKRAPTAIQTQLAQSLLRNSSLPPVAKTNLTHN